VHFVEMGFVDFGGGTALWREPLNLPLLPSRTGEGEEEVPLRPALRVDCTLSFSWLCLLDQIAAPRNWICASLWKSCFAKAIDIHFGLPLTAAGYIFRYSKMGLHLKKHGRRLPGFRISP
jgi:hypothetical protein